MGEPVQLALFDFDGTLIPGDSIALLVRWARKKRLITAAEFLSALAAAAGYGLGLVSAKASKEKALRFLARRSAGERDRINRDFARVLLPLVYPKALNCLRAHRDAGRMTVLVTASTDNYMRPVGEALGFDAVLATPYLPDGALGENCMTAQRHIVTWVSSVL